MFKNTLQFLVTLVVLVGLASPVAALDLRSGERWLFDDGCTDIYDVPATTVNVDVSDTTNFDSLGEAIDPDLNLKDDVQISGSADGWCDDAPWRIATSSISIAGASENMWLGPLQVNPSGFYVWAQYPTSQTNFGYVIMAGALPWSSTASDSIAAINGQTTMTTTVAYMGPYTEATVSVISVDEFQFPRGIPLYFRVDLTGTGDWDWDLALYPVMNHEARGSR